MDREPVERLRLGGKGGACLQAILRLGRCRAFRIACQQAPPKTKGKRQGGFDQMPRSLLRGSLLAAISGLPIRARAVGGRRSPYRRRSSISPVVRGCEPRASRTASAAAGKSTAPFGFAAFLRQIRLQRHKSGFGVFWARREILTLGRASRLDEPLRATARPEADRRSLHLVRIPSRRLPQVRWLQAVL